MAVEKPLDQIDDKTLFPGLGDDPPPPSSALAEEPPASGDSPPPKPGEPEPEAPPAKPEAKPEAKAPEETIPSWRLREEAEARRAAEARVAELEAGIRTHVRQQEATKGQEKPVDFFDDPARATQDMVTQALSKVLEPHVKSTQRTLNYLGQMTATQVHGKEAVSEAEKAVFDAMDAGTLTTAEYESIVQAPNRYDAAVQWHKNKKALETVGNDPEAFFQRRLDEMLADPAFQAKVVDKIKGAVSNGNGNGNGQVRLPPSLSNRASAAPARESLGDLSDQSLWQHSWKDG